VIEPLAKLLVAVAERRDLLRHFSKDGLWWRLAALCVIKLPIIGIAICLVYWQTHR
jgi:hypothetical protein